MGVRQPDGTILPACMDTQDPQEKRIRTTVEFVGGPLEGTTAFEFRPMMHVRQTGFVEGSKEFFRWIAYDLAMTNGGKVGFESINIDPDAYRKRYNRLMDATPEFCGYRLVQRDDRGGEIFAKFQFMEQP